MLNEKFQFHSLKGTEMTTKHRWRIAPALVLAGLLLLASTPSLALIDIEWRPACQSVEPGEMVEIGLYVVSDDETDQSISAMDIILLWDPDVIELVGVVDNGPYAWLISAFTDDFDGLNDTFLDGNALYTAYAQLGVPAYATPEGLLVTTVQFIGSQDPGFCWITEPHSAGMYSDTAIIDGEVPALRVEGVLGKATAGVGVFDLIYGYMNCTPSTGTLPFVSNFMVVLGSNYEDQTRRVAGRIDLTLASGTFYSNFRAGYTNLSPRECYAQSWNQNIPALGSVVGDNIFALHAQDVTPFPYNQPPRAPSGMTDIDICTITGVAP
jgi:hypothetical protein